MLHKPTVLHNPTALQSPIAASGVRRTTLAVGAGLTAAFCLAGTAIAPAAVAAAPAAQRLAGADRYETAVLGSRSAFPAGSVRTVVLASGTSTVDSLAASAAAGSLGSPVLLTRRDDLPATTAEELRRLGARAVVVVGGPSAVGTSVEEALRSGGFAVSRTAGGDRYSTAAELSRLTDASAETVFLAAGPADAAAAAPIAAAHGWPVLLTGLNSLPASTAAALSRFPDADVVVLGGPSVVSESVAQEAGAAQRIAGSDRFTTAAELAEFAVQHAGFDGDRIGVALGRNGTNGDDLADALASGPVLARTGTPLLLAESRDRLGRAAQGYLDGHPAATTTGPVVFGGTAVVGQSVVDAISVDSGAAAPSNPVPVHPVTPPVTEVPTVPPLIPPVTSPSTPYPVRTEPVRHLPGPIAGPGDPTQPTDGAAAVTAQVRSVTIAPGTPTAQVRGTAVNTAPGQRVSWQILDDTTEQEVSGGHGTVAPTTSLPDGTFTATVPTTGLVPGYYQLMLYVEDSRGVLAFDRVFLTVTGIGGLQAVYNEVGKPATFKGFTYGQSLLVVPPPGYWLTGRVRMVVDWDGRDAQGGYGSGGTVNYYAVNPADPVAGTADVLWSTMAFGPYYGAVFMAGPQGAWQPVEGGPDTRVMVIGDAVNAQGERIVLDGTWIPIGSVVPGT